MVSVFLVLLRLLHSLACAQKSTSVNMKLSCGGFPVDWLGKRDEALLVFLCSSLMLTGTELELSQPPTSQQVSGRLLARNRVKLATRL